MTEPSHAGSGPRLPLVNVEDYSEPLKTFLDGLVDKGVHPGIGKLHVVRTLANHPDLAIAYMSFGTYILGRSSLPSRARELATLRSAWMSGSDYEWSKHAWTASKAGMPKDEIEATKVGSADPVWGDGDRMVLRAVEQLLTDRDIDDEVWSGLKRELTDQQLADLVFTVGCYELLASAIRALRIEDD